MSAVTIEQRAAGAPVGAALLALLAAVLHGISPFLPLVDLGGTYGSLLDQLPTGRFRTGELVIIEGLAAILVLGVILLLGRRRSAAAGIFLAVGMTLALNVVVSLIFPHTFRTWHEDVGFALQAGSSLSALLAALFAFRSDRSKPESAPVAYQMPLPAPSPVDDQVRPTANPAAPPAP